MWSVNLAFLITALLALLSRLKVVESHNGPTVWGLSHCFHFQWKVIVGSNFGEIADHVRKFEMLEFPVSWEG